MDMKTLKVIITSLLLINITHYHANSCGWYEYEESYRISAFRAEIDILSSFRPFYYTPETLNDYFPSFNNTDRYKNIEEWQKLLNGNCRVEDAFTILYKVEPDMFLLAYENKNLKEVFEENTFIELLTKPKNKQWLDYFAFAKRNEFNNQYISNPWSDSYDYEIGTISSELISIAESMLSKTKNKNLQERYAYHLIRLYRQTDQNKKCIKIYDKYFKNSKNNSVLKIWSLLHKAEGLSAIGKKVEANYLFSKIFNQGVEKRVRAYRFFKKELLNETLGLAKNNEEIAGIWAIMAIKNPGPALNEIKLVVKNAPHHPSIALLIMREINKLEDWIFTPELTGHSPSLHFDEEYYEWNKNYEKIKQKNRRKDLNYLGEFNSWLKRNFQMFNPIIKDYLKLARAHLHLIAEENESAVSLFSSINKNAPRTIHVQKKIELALFYTYENKLDNNEIQIRLAKTLIELEELAKINNGFAKQLYSLGSIISKAFLKKNNIPVASLLKLKAEKFKDNYEAFRKGYWHSSDWKDKDYYWKIAFLDRYATTSDIDRFINIVEKKKKNVLEHYLCNQHIADKHALLDLKGTIALRNGDLKTANKALSMLPADYWKKHYKFSSFLNKNPFIPKILKNKTVPFNFNKAIVVKELVKLEDEAHSNPTKAAENYIKIGHFFYNASYWGNSWMMLSYFWTSNPNGYSYFYPFDVLLGDFIKNTENYVSSFYKCSIAIKYYNKALKHAKNKEQLAMIYFMKHSCEYNQYLWREKQHDWHNFEEKFTPRSLKRLYANYEETNIFRKVKCPLLDSFIEK